MNKRIIYQNDEGGVSVIIPCECGLTIEEIAAKDVPTGLPYKIVDVADLPDAPQETWDVDEADLTDGIGGESNEFD